jgi:hypothetical protein
MTTPRDRMPHGWPEGMPRTGPPGSPSGQARAATGPDRVREAIARDRGLYALGRRLTLCGEPDGTERRADQGERMTMTVIRDHVHQGIEQRSCARCGLPGDWHAGPVNRALYRFWRWLSRF